ncbi:B/F/G family RNA polymerase sigma-70 factor, partial [Actinoplanes sp. ATCC 53533]|uniref:sigma-70 family RNA polymerase sigma factor n=1 Tax=Actinoplanes sp. ATCC 53533 TaxID=1288362 RepID=UPI000F777F10
MTATAFRSSTLSDASASTETAAELLTRLARTPAGDRRRGALRDRAIEAWLPLARHLAHRYSGRGEPTDDLIQTANVGLIKAIDKFDPERGVDFAGYAIPTIIGEIKRHFRDRTWSVRVPRRLQELRLAITEANSTLTHTLGRSPTVADISVHLGVTE